MNNKSILVDITPDVNLVNSLRNSSHDFKSAICDIIDNSIDAECSNVWVNGEMFDKKYRLVISDDGWGMTIETLGNALRYGWHNPDNTDGLGKFGMGMKTSATSLGNNFFILTKTKDGNLLKAIYSPDDMIETNKWSAKVFETDDVEDISIFSKYTDGSDQGTVLIVQDLTQYNDTNLYTACDHLRKYIGRTFRYFLTPITQPESNSGKCKIIVNGKETFGLDPLERQAKNTKILTPYDNTIDVGDGRTAAITVVELAEVDAGNCSPGDSGEHNFHVCEPNQGISVVRENREICFTRTGAFRPIWGSDHPWKNYLRAEIRYSNMDDVFRVNHDKSSIREFPQSVLDILKDKITKIINSAALQRQRANKKIVGEDEQKVHDAAMQNANSKKKLLEMPKKKIEKRSSKGESEGTVDPKKSGKTRSGKYPSTTNSDNIHIEFTDLGPAGQLFESHYDKNIIVVSWNTSHPFYQKYVSGNAKETILSLDAMLIGLVTLLEIEKDKKNREDENYSDGITWVNNFINSFSNNLRTLAT
jgi:hypothetical protein